MIYFGEAEYPENTQLAIKEANARMIFDAIAARDGISRAQLAEETGLSPSTVSVITDELIKNKFIVQKGAGESATAGRKPICLGINPDGYDIVVFSFRTTGILCIIYDFKLTPKEELFQPYGPLFSTARVVLGKRKNIDPEKVTDILDSLLKRSKVFNREKTLVASVSYPGNYSNKYHLLESSLFGWYVSWDFIRLFRERYDNLPVLLGDETVFMASNDRNQLDRTEDSAVYVYTGFGVGSAVVINGKFYQGRNMDSGELGHISINMDGKSCPCGGKGCLECYASTDAIIDAVIEKIKDGRDSLALKIAGYDEKHIHMETLRTAYEMGDEVVSEVLNDLARKIIVGTGNMLCSFGSMNVHIGGDIRKLGQKFLDLIIEISKTTGHRYTLDECEFDWAESPENSECRGGALEYVRSYIRFVS